MRRALVLLLVLLAAAPADAQRRRARDRDDGAPRAFAEQGDVALTFSIDGLDLAPFEGGVGARLWLTDRTVGAASLGFGYRREDSDYGEVREAFSTRFSVGVERHFGRGRRVSPFVGLGASVGYAELDTDEVYYEYPEPAPCTTEGCPVPDGYPYTYDTQEARVGAAAALGAEVRLVEGLTLSAAYRLGLDYVRGEGGGSVPTLPPTCEGCEGGLGYDPYGEYERVEVGTGTSSLTLSIYL